MHPFMTKIVTNEAATTSQIPFLESEIYEYPQRVLNEALQELGMSDDTEIQEYLLTVLKNDDKRGEQHQGKMSQILQQLIERGEKEKAGLMFNIHRVLTEFEGYGANDKASSDVKACFSPEHPIPDNGVIIVDFFVTRNLPEIIEMCENRGIDLSRIRVHAPRAILALQLMQLTGERRMQFEGACEKLAADQFRAPGVYHVGDIQNEEPVAIWFSPRTMPIYPRLHAETQAQTIQNYMLEFRNRALNIVEGGRIFANLAFSSSWQPLAVERENKTRPLTKLTGISEIVATQCVIVLFGEGLVPVNSESEATDFNPITRNPRIDHGKQAKNLHFVRKKKL